jgi:GT2 family glycosyltransferase
MMDDSTIAVCLVTRNRANTLRDALASVMSQSHRPDELVVVDNASADESLAVARATGAHVVARDRNIGCAAGRNLAAQQSTCDLVFFFDDDAVLSRDAVEQALAVAIAHPAAIVVAPRILEEEQAGLSVWADAVVPCATFTGTCVMRREEFLELGAYPETFVYGAEEHDFGFRVLDAGRDILYAPSIVVHHRPGTAGRDVHSEVRAKLTNHVYVRWKYLPIPLALLATLRTVVAQARCSAHDHTLGAWAKAVVGIPRTVIRATRERSRIARPTVQRYRMLERAEELRRA